MRRGIDHWDWWKKPLEEGKNPCFGCEHTNCGSCTFYTEHLNKQPRKEYKIYRPTIEIREKRKHKFQTLKNLEGNIIFKCVNCGFTTDRIGEFIPECEGDGHR